jgi:hypothetical protein
MRQEVMTPGTNERRTVFGALDLVTGAWHYTVSRKADSLAFICFATRLLQTYATAPVIALVCDNGIIHPSRATRVWLADHPRLRVLYGARYSPHHNPVERIWAALKAYLANTPTATMAARVGQVHAFFGWSSPAQLLATAAPVSSPWLPEGYARNFRRAAQAQPQCISPGGLVPDRLSGLLVGEVLRDLEPLTGVRRPGDQPRSPRSPKAMGAAPSQGPADQAARAWSC